MTSNDDWQESLGNFDDLISCLGSLETEDVIYLEEYLAGEGGLGSRSPSLWSALRECSEGNEAASPRTGQEDGVHRELAHTTVDDDDSENVDDPQVPPETARLEALVGVRAVHSKCLTLIISIICIDTSELYRIWHPIKLLVYSGSDTVGTSLGPRQTRTTRGVSRPRFVSYEAFPPTKDKPFLCELCGRRLATRESRRRHIIARHIKERNNVCGICGKSFVFKFSLKAHTAVHSATPNFTCVCGQTFSVRGSYMNHVRRVHQAASEVKYSCELCFKSFVDHHTLRLHLISVHKPKTIACLHSGCKKVFSTGALMKSHYWYHLKQRFPCDECGQTFSTESYMYKHRRTHSGIRPYMCVDCGKTYLSVSHLNKHRRAAHSTYRPFQCSFCGKCYKTKDQLTFHESSHRGEKPYKCEVCGYATAYRNTYYAHRKKHQSPSSGNSPQKKDKGESSSLTQNTSKENKTSNSGKNRDKNNITKEKSSSKYRSSYGVISCETHSPNNSVAPRVLELDASSESVVGAGLGTSALPATTSVNVICVVSSETNNTSVLPKVSRGISTSFPMQIESPSSKAAQSPASAAFIPSEAFSLVPEADAPTETGYSGSQCSGKPESFELVANSDMADEGSRNFSEEQTSCIILTNSAKCSFPACENNDESLLLFRVDDESYVALCTQHSLTDLTIDTVKEGSSLKNMTSVNMSTQVLDSLGYQEVYDHKSVNESVQQESSNSLTLKMVATEADLPELVTQGSAEPVEEETTSGNTLVQLMSHSAAAAPDMCFTSLPPTQHLDCMKPSSEVCLTEHFSAMMELDSSIAGLPEPVVDESFSLAQMEVRCPLCEQFLCMDDYVTHLECCHN